jgi:hypothetical protein
MKQTTNDRIDMQQRNLLRLTPQTQHDRHAYDEFKKVDEMFDPPESSGVFDAETRLRFPCREGFSFFFFFGGNSTSQPLHGQGRVEFQ